MANSVTTQILANTDRKLVIQRVMVSDGTEETKAVMVDISDSAYNSSGGKAMTGVAVEQLTATTQANSAGPAAVRIGWDATNLYPFAFLGTSFGYLGNAVFFAVSSEWGGVTKDSITIDAGTGAGSGKPTGDIAITTTDFDAGEMYVVQLVLRKIF